MSRFKNCAVVLNTLSGSGDARNIFASSLQRYFLQSGIAHQEIYVPGPAAHSHRFLGILDSARKSEHDAAIDAVVVCGGDGTINSMVNVVATTKHAEVANRPLILVPAGEQNSLCTSLGMTSAERSVSACLSGRIEELPIWEVLLNGVPTRYVVGTVGIGTYANVVRQMKHLSDSSKDFVGVPQIRRRFSAATVWESLVRHESWPISVSMVTCVSPANGDGVGSSQTTTITLGGSSLSSGDDDASGRPGSVVAGRPAAVEVVGQRRMRTLVASQLPFQHSSYSLTPHAALLPRGRHATSMPTLSVTHADSRASRLRMLHLLWREAKQGHILNEDGVGETVGVRELTVAFDDACPVVLDGEPLVVDKGSVMVVRPFDRRLRVVVA